MVGAPKRNPESVLDERYEAESFSELKPVSNQNIQYTFQCTGQMISTSSKLEIKSGELVANKHFNDVFRASEEKMRSILHSERDSKFSKLGSLGERGCNLR